MPFETRWADDTQTIYYVGFVGDWTWEELAQVYKTCAADYESVPHKVHVIYDFTKAGRLPRNVLSNGGSMATRPHPNIETHILVLGKNRLVQTLFDIFNRLYIITNPKSHSFIHAATVDEALAKLDTHLAGHS